MLIYYTQLNLCGNKRINCFCNIEWVNIRIIRIKFPMILTKIVI